MSALVSFVAFAWLRLGESLKIQPNADCRPEQYGREGHWVSDKEWGMIWDDKGCGVLPDFDAKTFCTEKLQCQNMLFVGDSTIGQFYFALLETLNDSFRGHAIDGGGIHPPGKLIEGVTDEDFYTDCGKPRLKGEPNQRNICQAYCSNPVHVTLIRHDHLNGRRVDMEGSPAQTRTACAWKQELADHPWVVLHTGSHVNDSPEELMNVNSTWETRARDLFSSLKTTHPRGIVWRTAHPGYFDHTRNIPQAGHKQASSRTQASTTCLDPAHMRDSPLPDDEIDTTVRRGSWAQMPHLNEVYKKALLESVPDGLILDTEPLMTMRGDCRMDMLHFEVHNKKSPIHMWTRMLQFFMKPLKT